MRIPAGIERALDRAHQHDLLGGERDREVPFLRRTRSRARPRSSAERHGELEYLADGWLEVLIPFPVRHVHLENVDVEIAVARVSVADGRDSVSGGDLLDAEEERNEVVRSGPPCPPPCTPRPISPPRRWRVASSISRSAWRTTAATSTSMAPCSRAIAHTRSAFLSMSALVVAIELDDELCGGVAVGDGDAEVLFGDLDRVALHELENGGHDPRVHERRHRACAASRVGNGTRSNVLCLGSGTSLRNIFVITASVPSEPTISCVRL